MWILVNIIITIIIIIIIIIINLIITSLHMYVYINQVAVGDSL